MSSGGLFPERQPSLFSTTGQVDGRAAAGWCARQLAERFRSDYAGAGAPSSIPEWLCAAGRACLLVVSDYEPEPAPGLVEALTLCRDELKTTALWRYLDAMPFDISLQLLQQPSTAIEILERNLSNGMSSIRGYCLDLAWICRRHLSVEKTGDMRVADRLLRNTANTLAYWDTSLALCRHLFASSEAFWAGIEFYPPEPFADQYAERLKYVREHPAAIEQPASLLAMEMDARRRVEQTVFGASL